MLTFALSFGLCRRLWPKSGISRSDFYWDGIQYVSLFDEQLPIPWSYEDPGNIEPRVLNHEVDALLDVAWLADPQQEMRTFGILNAESKIPISFFPAWHWILEHPANNLKLDILVTAPDCVSVRLSHFNIHRGALSQIGSKRRLDG